MSETRPSYIPCASGNNAQTDCLILRHGDLVRLLGHPSMDFTPEDAARLATALLHIAHQAGYDGADEHVAQLRSEIAMALHVPVMVDSLSRPLLEQAREALSYLERESDYWRREYLAAAALNTAEMDDGK